MPELLFYDESGEICDVPYFFMSFIDGKPLNDTEGLTAEQYGNVKYDAAVPYRYDDIRTSAYLPEYVRCSRSG